MEFSAAVRGYHYYMKYWHPSENECLDCAHEKENAFDYFAIKTCQKDGTIVGHLPMEISRSTKFILDRGARITATLTSTSYYASPLTQGGLEILCRVEVFMPRTRKNKEIISIYEDMVSTLYQEKDGRPVIGSILTFDGDEVIKEQNYIERRGKKRKSVVGKSLVLKSDGEKKLGKDIRTFFQKSTVSKSRVSAKKQETIVVID